MTEPSVKRGSRTDQDDLTVVTNDKWRLNYPNDGWVTLDLKTVRELVDFAEGRAPGSGSHWHRQHGRWDKDGSVCSRCALIAGLRRQLFQETACLSCAEHYPPTPEVSP